MNFYESTFKLGSPKVERQAILLMKKRKKRKIDFADYLGTLQLF